ncbi:unnamed protein product [Cyprideis torosa]|uniref:Uncharacterized protein n=1 Tax=Cyprideis torosa TaxID=163714 RepID=A0A7R8W9M3_9CRUS|nr:unnamed protein product [Cyprideis torosa]CAG0885475.1 unnamed protein product [Cyprideis torosa]
MIRNVHEIPLLMRVLDDRVNYGVFLDDASSVLLLQHLIQRENFGDAARASTFLMLQEELDLNPMATTLSLLACHLAVRRGSAVEADEGAKPGLFWEYEEPPAEEEDEENVEYRKIKALESNALLNHPLWLARVEGVRNSLKGVHKGPGASRELSFMSIPYFDDHFDLRQPRHLVGKTLVEVCPVIPDLPVGDDSTKATLVASSKLLGFALWEKKDLLLKAVEDAKTTPVHPDIQQVLGQYIEGIEDDLKELKVDPSLPNPEEMCLSLHKEMEALHGEKVVQEIGELYDEFVARRKREVARELEATKLRSRMEKVKETKEELLDKER